MLNQHEHITFHSKVQIETCRSHYAIYARLRDGRSIMITAWSLEPQCGYAWIFMVGIGIGIRIGIGIERWGIGDGRWKFVMGIGE